MLILKIAAVALITCILTLTLKKDQPAFAILLSTCGAFCLLALVLQKILPVLDWVRSLATYTPGENIGCLLQVLGIAIVAQFAADLCKEAGLASAASSVELCGRMLAVLQAMPLLQNLINAFLMYLQ